MSQKPDVQGFWRWFADNQERILEIMAGRREGKVTELLDEALAAHGLNLTYEITEGMTGGELTFTPQGDPKVAAFIDSFVEQAPKLDTWVIYGRVQPKSLDGAIAFVEAVHGVDLSGLHFKVKEVEGVYHLLFLSDVLMGLEEDKRYQVAATFLDHALGEDVAMEFVGSVDFKPARDGGIAPALVINQITRETGGTGDLVLAGADFPAPE